MEHKRLITIAITVAIAVMLSTLVLAPIVGSYSDETAYYRNVGSYFASTDSEDDTVHTIIVSAGPNGFIVKTDGRTDITPNMATYNPGGVYVADAVGIGVYEAYNNNGVLTSMSGVTPTVSQNINAFRDLALAGNDSIAYGTYQLWNNYQNIMYKIMALATIGNTDVQYMMGPGKTTGSESNTTGLTNAGIEKSATSADSISLYIENAYGSVWEFVGDTKITNYVVNAGNVLGGNPFANIKNTLTTQATIIPSNVSGQYINTIYTASDVFGIPQSVLDSTESGIPGGNINDAMWSATGNRVIYTGGAWLGEESAGLFAWRSTAALNYVASSLGARLAYIIPDMETSADYGYVITFGEGGSTITNVQVNDGGSLISVMPTGTTLNEFWNFNTETGVGPFGAYYAAINLATGSNTDDATEERLSSVKGEIAYILDPTDLHKTLGGTTFDPTLYNVMLIVPTMYWYSNPDTNTLYVGSSPDKFPGVTMVPYAHTYTIDPAVDTGGIVNIPSTSLAVGEDSIIRLYETGDVRLITADGSVSIGQAVGENTVTFTVTGDTLGYGDAQTQGNILAYIASDGEYVMTLKPKVKEDSNIIIGGYASALPTSGSSTVNVGYCANGTIGEFTEANITTVLNPVSTDGATYTSTAVTVNTSEYNEYGVLQVDSILFDGIWSESETSTATYSYFLAPAVIGYENPDYVEGPAGTILGMIPLFVIIGILGFLATALFVRFRN